MHCLDVSSKYFWHLALSMHPRHICTLATELFMCFAQAHPERPSAALTGKRCGCTAPVHEATANVVKNSVEQGARDLDRQAFVKHGWVGAREKELYVREKELDERKKKLENEKIKAVETLKETTTKSSADLYRRTRQLNARESELQTRDVQLGQQHNERAASLTEHAQMRDADFVARMAELVKREANLSTTEARLGDLEQTLQAWEADLTAREGVLAIGETSVKVRKDDLNANEAKVEVWKANLNKFEIQLRDREKSVQVAETAVKARVDELTRVEEEASKREQEMRKMLTASPPPRVPTVASVTSFGTHPSSCSGFSASPTTLLSPSSSSTPSGSASSHSPFGTSASWGSAISHSPSTSTYGSYASSSSYASNTSPHTSSGYTPVGIHRSTGSANGSPLNVGPRGGTSYINKNGNKTYPKSKK
jgi:hypothetical protein